MKPKLHFSPMIKSPSCTGLSSFGQHTKGLPPAVLSSPSNSSADSPAKVQVALKSNTAISPVDTMVKPDKVRRALTQSTPFGLPVPTAPSPTILRDQWMGTSKNKSVGWGLCFRFFTGRAGKL